MQSKRGKYGYVNVLGLEQELGITMNPFSLKKSLLDKSFISIIEN
jgi:hypothetical protein